MYPELISPTSDQCDSALDQATLIQQLNTLLISLHLPIPLMSPTDLTPRLLIAILESLMGKRLPINYNHELRASKRTHAENVQAMKIFLGVLETDFLQKDVGLSNLDPRRLADGEWEEVLFIAELLCWVGRQAGLVSASNDTNSTPSQHQNQPISTKQRLSPKSQLDLDAESLFQTGSTVTGIERFSERTFSPFINEKGGDSVTSINSFEDRSMSDAFSDVDRPFRNHPRCIHEVSPPSLLFSIDPPIRPNDRTPSPDHNWSFCGCHPSIADTLPIEHDHPNTQSRMPIRTTGFIQPVDEEAELASFESSRSMLFSTRHRPEYSDQSNHLQNPSQTAAKKILALHAQYTRTVNLLNERAHLLTQLADYQNS